MLPTLEAVGWDDEPHSFGEQRIFTDGRIVVVGTDRTETVSPDLASQNLLWNRPLVQYNTRR